MKDSDFTMPKIAATCVGGLLTILAAGFFGSLWSIANNNSDNDDKQDERIDKVLATQSALADEVSKLKAELKRAQTFEGPLPQISAEAVETAREGIQQVLDKAAARQEIIK